MLLWSNTRTKMMELYSLGEIKDDVLFHTCGIKNYNGFYRKVSGPTANILHAITLPTDTPCLKPTNLIKTSY